MGTQYSGVGRIGRHQSIPYTGTAGTIALTIQPGTYKVRVCATSACYIAIGSNPTATTAGVYMPGDSPEYFTCHPGEKVSAIQLSAGGTLHVTEIG